ncbi:FecCD family ABC transporter permease [Microbacterium sp. K27]|uniref:FecCD family ABC transporter permease n=1 Tax=Microbacterium sp. K27 TaxID=2305445 RepID=UPI00197B83E1|nr:iron ABC transporter permease [Microbacterium sp. K27]
MSTTQTADASERKVAEEIATDPRAVLGPVRSSTRRRLLGLVALLVLLAVAALLSLAIGARDIAPDVVVRALSAALSGAPDGDFEATVVITERLPRTVLGLLVGACLGGAGVLMQGLTRNPLVDGGILGVEMGAACAVVAGIVLMGLAGVGATFWFALALAGAGIAAALVFSISRLSRAASTAMSLVVAGAATAAMLAAVINLLIVRDNTSFSRYRFWSIGQLAGRGETIPELWPFAVTGIVLALLCGATLNALSLGESTAAALGVRVRRAQLGVAFVAVLLCAAAVAAAGPIGFIGLIGAHLGRLIVGADQRLLVPFGMVCGAAVLLAADVAGRITPGNGEIAVGIMTAVVGTPVFVVLARTRKLVEA